MRKDLKIGMAIGAVLLVVLIVYLAVPDNSSDVAQHDGTAGEEQVTPSETTPQPETPAEQPVAEAPTPKNEPTAAEPTETPAEVATAAKPGKKDPFEPEPGMWADLLEKGKTSVTMTPLRNTGLEAPTGATPTALEEKPAEKATPEATGTISTAAPEDVTVAKPNEKTATAEEAKPEKTNEATGTESKTGARTHTVKAGEDFSKIARDAYGDAKYYLAIMKANPTIEPTRLKVGTVITLPDISSTKSEGSSGAGTAIATIGKKEKELDPEKEYRVQAGDSLYKIAMKHYRSSNMVEAIYDANKETIGDDSSRLKQGMVLKLPANTSR